MAYLSWFVFFFLILIYHAAASFHICETTYCAINEPSIQFPFQRVGEANQSSRCGYPGFALSCNNSRTMFNLPNSGDFLVDSISYEDQTLWISDPDGCLPRRFLNKFNLAGSPFELSDDYRYIDLTFYNCSSSNVTQLYPLRPITCLSSALDPNHTVVAALSDPPFSAPWDVSSCEVISAASVPYSVNSGSHWMNLNADIGLKWYKPHCGDCVARKGQCGFFKDTGLDIACYLPSQGGLSKSGKYAISLGVGIPVVLCVIVLACLYNGKRRRENGERRQGSNIELNVARSSAVVGLDGAAIEKYPMTRIGDSGRLPDPNDNVCSICLCDYQPHDTLRTIPDCNHYFHANCIDGWLQMNATCPLCRKLPHI